MNRTDLKRKTLGFIEPLLGLAAARLILVGSILVVTPEVSTASFRLIKASSPTIKRLVRSCKRAANASKALALPEATSEPGPTAIETTEPEIGRPTTTEDFKLIDQSLNAFEKPHFLHRNQFSIRVTGFADRNLFSPTKILEKGNQDVMTIVETLESLNFKFSGSLAVLISAHPGSLKILQDPNGPGESPGRRVVGLNGFSMPLFITQSQTETWGVAQGHAGLQPISETSLGNEFGGQAFHILALTPLSTTQHGVDYKFALARAIAHLTASPNRWLNSSSKWRHIYADLLASLATGEANGQIPSPFSMVDTKAGAVEYNSKLSAGSQSLMSSFHQVRETFGAEALAELIQYIDGQDLRTEEPLLKAPEKGSKTSFLQRLKDDPDEFLESLDRVSEIKHQEIKQIETLMRVWLHRKGFSMTGPPNRLEN